MARPPGADRSGAERREIREGKVFRCALGILRSFVDTGPSHVFPSPPRALSCSFSARSIVGALDALKSAGLTDVQQEIVDVISGGAALILALVEDTQQAYTSERGVKSMRSKITRVDLREQLIRQSFRTVRLQNRLQQKLWALDPTLEVSPRVPITASLDVARSLAVYMSLVRPACAREPLRDRWISFPRVQVCVELMSCDLSVALPPSLQLGNAVERAMFGSKARDRPWRCSHPSPDDQMLTPDSPGSLTTRGLLSPLPATLALQIKVFADYDHYEEHVVFRVQYKGDPLTEKENRLLSSTQFGEGPQSAWDGRRKRAKATRNTCHVSLRRLSGVAVSSSHPSSVLIRAGAAPDFSEEFGTPIMGLVLSRDILNALARRAACIVSCR